MGVLIEEDLHHRQSRQEVSGGIVGGRHENENHTYPEQPRPKQSGEPAGSLAAGGEIEGHLGQWKG